jgi:CheY-like chemotaxis protein
MASVLIVEDVPAVLVSMRIILAGAGHAITCAQDGVQGLRALKADRFDLVICDIWMPGLSGAEVIAQGRLHAPQIKFLAITGGNPNSNAGAHSRDATDLGADAVLYKPFEKAELLKAVDALLSTAPAHG